MQRLEPWTLQTKYILFSDKITAFYNVMTPYYSNHTWHDIHLICTYLKDIQLEHKIYSYSEMLPGESKRDIFYSATKKITLNKIIIKVCLTLKCGTKLCT